MYFVAGLDVQKPERFKRAMSRHSDVRENNTSKNLDVQEIERKSTAIALAQKRGYAKAREIEQKKLEEERKKRIERAAITVVKKQENSSWFDQLSDVQKKYVAEAREKIQREYQADKKHLGERKALAIANKKKKELKQWCKVNFLNLSQEEEK